MSYIPETDEIIYNDEERALIMNSPKLLEYLFECTTVRGKVCYASVARHIQEQLQRLRRRHLIPADWNAQVPFAPINNTNYADLQIEFEWNKDTLTYAPVKFFARKKGGREYKQIQIENFVWNNMKSHSERINIQGKSWRYR
jgi:hypothetical protein